MLSQKKPLIEQIINPLVLLLKPVHPNLLSVIGSIPPLLFFVFLVKGYIFLALLMVPLFSLDLLDGTVARAHGRASAFGEFLDSTLDRVSDFLVISAFGFANLVRFEIVIVFLFAAFMVSYTRSRGELAGKRQVAFNIGFMERTERLAGVTAGMIVYIFAPLWRFSTLNVIEMFFVFLSLLSFVTFFQRCAHAYKNL